MIAIDLRETFMARHTFEQWIERVFDHAVFDPAWISRVGDDTALEDGQASAAYLARLFANSSELLGRFDDAQVGEGLRLIASAPRNGEHASSLIVGTADWPTRQRAVRAIFDLYADCFAARCTEGLGHLSGANEPLNTICYMWWDVFPLRWDWPETPHQAEAEECLEVMTRCLSLNHDACVEGALHGLGHWRKMFPTHVDAIIDRFLSERPNLRPQLAVYARRAVLGQV